MKSRIEPDLINCTPLFEVDDRQTEMALYCQKHGTHLITVPVPEGFDLAETVKPGGEVREKWDSRSCKE